MKNLRLQALRLKGTALTRNELKNVMGGKVAPPVENCTNACGGALGTCGAGYTCTSVACPGDPAFTHTVCQASAA